MRVTIGLRNSMSEIVVRQASDEDEQFLREVYFSTRADEVSAFGWDTEQQSMFLDMQFRVRRQSYKIQCPAAEYFVVEVSGRDAGSLIVDRSTKNIRLVDIAIKPEYRGHGVATYLIKMLQTEAVALAGAVLLQVDIANSRAKCLYEKNGFAVTAATQIYFEMAWNGENR